MAREDLHAYFQSVARKLVERGVIRRGSGQSINDIVRSELPAVLREVENDFVVVGADLGLKFARGVGSIGALLVQQGAERGAQAVGSFLNDLFKRRG